MAKHSFSEEETQQINAILADVSQGHTTRAVHKLRVLKDHTYAAIPDKKRQSRGITWVLQHISKGMTEACGDDTAIAQVSNILYDHMATDDDLLGVPIFMMADYGKTHPSAVFPFFAKAAKSDNWKVREFAQCAFRRIIRPNRDLVLPWLEKMARSNTPNQRRFASETLRPVVENRWLKKEPEASLRVLRLLFHETDPYPRTSVGNNLSDLSRSNPELIFTIIEELATNGDDNSRWIAHRACRNLVKKEPERVLDVLDVDEYHYKDRHYHRRKTDSTVATNGTEEG
jgi:3-methyladenine DNA glycosylase AlkC